MSVLFVVDVTSIRKKDMEKKKKKKGIDDDEQKHEREEKLDIIWYQMKKR